MLIFTSDKIEKYILNLLTVCISYLKALQLFLLVSTNQYCLIFRFNFAVRLVGLIVYQLIKIKGFL